MGMLLLGLWLGGALAVTLSDVVTGGVPKWYEPLVNLLWPLAAVSELYAKRQ